MPYLFSEGLTTLSSSLGVLETFIPKTPQSSISSSEETPKNDGDGSIGSALNFKKLTIEYMNYEAQKYGYPDIFAAMSLKNSSLPELTAEGASWSDFFDSGMTYSDYTIKTNTYTSFTNEITSIKEDTSSPKVSFTPSLTYPSLAI
jgi:hypothetical protein